jgi:Sushi repeat (SCR repeat)/F5/8 type C domain/Calcium-binding EGF domain
LPQIPNGFIVERQQTDFFFGDVLTVGCLPGFQLRGSMEVTCNMNETFGELPTCEDIDECQDSRTCDSDSTACINVPGDHYCQCRAGFTGVAPCRQSVMFGIGAFRPEMYGVTVSGSVPEYSKAEIGLSSKGWCGSAAKPSDNWVEIDLKAPKVISAVRILPVVGGKTVASVRSFTLSYRNMDSSQSEFHQFKQSCLTMLDFFLNFFLKKILFVWFEKPAFFSGKRKYVNNKIIFFR